MSEARKWVINNIRTVPIGTKLLSPVIMAEMRLHGTPARNIKKLHFEQIPGQTHQKLLRAYAYQQKFFANPDGTSGFEVRCPATPEMVEQCAEAIRNGTSFKIYTPKIGVRIYMDRNLIQRIQAHNKRVGFKDMPENFECRGYLSSFDLKNGIAIMRLVFAP